MHFDYNQAIFIIGIVFFLFSWLIYAKVINYENTNTIKYFKKFYFIAFPILIMSFFIIIIQLSTIFPKNIDEIHVSNLLRKIILIIILSSIPYYLNIIKIKSRKRTIKKIIFYFSLAFLFFFLSEGIFYHVYYRF